MIKLDLNFFEGLIKVPRMLSNVVLPAPDSPTTEIISPLFTIRLTPFKTWTFSYILCMLVAFTIFSKLKKINLISAMI